MRTIQDSAIAEKGLPDIQSNFYVSSWLFLCLQIKKWVLVKHRKSIKKRRDIKYT